MIYLSNAFSLQMLSLDRVNYIEVTPLELKEVKELLSKGFISPVGHVDTANILTNMLGVEVPMNRVSLTLTPYDTLIVAQLVGGRLPEGTTTLPDGITFQFLKVNIII